MLHFYGDDAETMLFPEQPVAFDEKNVKRDKNGRFAAKGSAEAVLAAKESLKQTLKGAKTSRSANELTEKLSNLTVKQLTDIKKEYGISASGDKATLIQKLADRLDRGRRESQQESLPTQPKKESKKKKTGLTKATTTSESLRDAYMLADTPEQGVAKLAEWITKTGQSSSIQRHGMAKSEVMRTVRVDGVDWHTAVGAEAAAAKTMSLLYQQYVPSKVMDAIGQVVHTTQKNKDDEHWGKQYGIANFTSAATGGDGGIVVYSGNPVSTGTLSHEAGHNVATKIWGKTAPSKESEYGKAQQAELPVSSYGANSPDEDFAEAVEMFVKSPDEMKREFPKKFAALQKIMET